MKPIAALDREYHERVGEMIERERNQRRAEQHVDQHVMELDQEPREQAAFRALR